MSGRIRIVNLLFPGFPYENHRKCAGLRLREGWMCLGIGFEDWRVPIRRQGCTQPACSSADEIWFVLLSIYITRQI